MCISIFEAQFSSTSIYTGVAEHKGETVHVLGYQNTSENYGDGANAMVFPFPAGAPMTPKNSIDNKGNGTLLSSMAERFQVQPDDLSEQSYGGPAASAAAAGGYSYTYQTGGYTVVLASKPSLAGHALRALPDSLRPSINVNMLLFFTQTYPGWPIAICCFNSRAATQNKGIFFWYKPKTEKYLWAPGVDAHDGHRPDLSKDVKVDTTLMIGLPPKPYMTVLTDNGVVVRNPANRDTPLVPFMQAPVVGGTMPSKMPNADYLIRLEEWQGKMNPHEIPMARNDGHKIVVRRGMLEEQLLADAEFLASLPDALEEVRLDHDHAGLLLEIPPKPHHVDEPLTPNRADLSAIRSKA